jgi:hydrogenase/urease accessory protein HupE
MARGAEEEEMRALVTRTLVGAAVSIAALPVPLSAHAGHAGEHGWLAGALQPLLSLDHLAAGVFVAVVLSTGLGTLAYRMRAKRTT